MKKTIVIDWRTTQRSFGKHRPHCPTCGKSLDTSRGPRLPKAGDITVSVCCAEPLRYVQTEQGLQLRLLTPEEIGQLSREYAFALGMVTGEARKAKAEREAAKE